MYVLSDFQCRIFTTYLPFDVKDRTCAKFPRLIRIMGLRAEQTYPWHSITNENILLSKGIYLFIFFALTYSL